MLKVGMLGYLEWRWLGCIYSLQPLPSRCFISANRGRSVLLVRTVRPCTSTTEIPTVSSNVYINDYNALNASSDVKERQSRKVRSCTPDGPRGRHNSFYRTCHLRFFRFCAYRTVRAWGQTVRAWSRAVLAFPSDGPQCWLAFMQCSCPRHTLVSRTVRRKGPDGPRLVCFFKKFLLSRIIYDIPDSRFKIVVDELMHLWNDQLEQTS
jgi:hypothetical protein